MGLWDVVSGGVDTMADLWDSEGGDGCGVDGDGDGGIGGHGMAGSLDLGIL